MAVDRWACLESPGRWCLFRRVRAFPDETRRRTFLSEQTARQSWSLISPAVPRRRPNPQPPEESPLAKMPPRLGATNIFACSRARRPARGISFLRLTPQRASTGGQSVAWYRRMLTLCRSQCPRARSPRLSGAAEGMRLNLCHGARQRNSTRKVALISYKLKGSVYVRTGHTSSWVGVPHG